MKIIGSIFILFSSIFASFYYEKSLKSKINKCEEIIEFLSYIKIQIEYFSTPINLIFEKYDKKTETIISLIKGEKIKILNQETDAKIYDFFSTIGKGFKKEQITFSDYTLNLVNDNLRKLKDEYPKKAKVFRSMSLFFGFCTIILLI